MNIYKALKIFGKIKSKRIKLLGLLTMHITKRRYIGIFLDSVMACNLRCRMCYMSDSSKIKDFIKRRPFNTDEIDTLAKSLFHRALKLQIGCATEPTISPILESIVACGKKYGIPYISLTTNGQLLNGKSLENLIKAGLNEITLSVHGLRKETYEYLMNGAKFEVFKALINSLKELKRSYPNFKIRLNYVVNSMNRADLSEFFTGVLSGLDFDILQIRPFQDVGETSYSDHDLSGVITDYSDLIEPIVKRCIAEGRNCLVPELENLQEVNLETDGFSDFVERLTYYYVSPATATDNVRIAVNKPGYNPAVQTFEQYHNENRTLRKILCRLRTPDGDNRIVNVNTTKKLNYKVK